MTHPFSSRACPIVLLAIVTVTLPLSTTAQENAVPTTPVKQGPALTVDMQVGDATHNLLALQREGTHASKTPRHLTGEVANLNYQRYLDSFKFPIPEKFNAAVQKSPGGGSR